MAFVIIGCRLPNGLTLELPGKPPVVLNGQNSAQAGRPIILLSEDDCGYTEVDADFWQAWKAAYKGFAPLESNAIFEAKNKTDAKSIAKELKKEKTGHEPLPQKTGEISKAE
jgi:hypothetical protein